MVDWRFGICAYDARLLTGDILGDVGVRLKTVRLMLLRTLTLSVASGPST